MPTLLGLLRSYSSLTPPSPSKLLILYVLIVSHDSSCQRLFNLHMHFVATYVSHDSSLQASTHPFCLHIFGLVTVYLEIFARRNFRELSAELNFRVFIFANEGLTIYIVYIANDLY